MEGVGCRGSRSLRQAPGHSPRLPPRPLPSPRAHLWVRKGKRPAWKGSQRSNKPRSVHLGKPRPARARMRATNPAMPWRVPGPTAVPGPCSEVRPREKRSHPCGRIRPQGPLHPGKSPKTGMPGPSPPLEQWPQDLPGKGPRSRPSGSPSSGPHSCKLLSPPLGLHPGHFPAKPHLRPTPLARRARPPPRSPASLPHLQQSLRCSPKGARGACDTRTSGTQRDCNQETKPPPTSLRPQCM